LIACSTPSSPPSRRIPPHRVRPGCCARIAKKLGEEAVEVVIDAINGNRSAVVNESADLLYNLVVLWVSSGVHPADVWKEMERRERLFGIAEKLRKEGLDPEPRRKVVALEARHLRKRR
jgi:phosphoribosyl-ATP pyrophosphohydrolase